MSAIFAPALKRGFSVIEGAASLSLVFACFALASSAFLSASRDYRESAVFSDRVLGALVSSERAAWSCGTALSYCDGNRTFLHPLSVSAEAPPQPSQAGEFCVTRVVSGGVFVGTVRWCA